MIAANDLSQEQQLYTHHELIGRIAGIKTSKKRSGSVLGNIYSAQRKRTGTYIGHVTIRQALEIVISIPIVETA